MNIKILVATHKPYWMPEDSAYLPIHVGKEGKIDYVFLDRDALKISVSMELQEGEALPDATYDAEIVTETIKPISFLLN